MRVLSLAAVSTLHKVLAIDGGLTGWGAMSNVEERGFGGFTMLVWCCGACALKG